MEWAILGRLRRWEARNEPDMSHTKPTMNERLISHIEQQHLAINAALGNEQITRDRVSVLEAEVARLLAHVGLDPMQLPVSEASDMKSVEQ